MIATNSAWRGPQIDAPQGMHGDFTGTVRFLHRTGFENIHESLPRLRSTGKSVRTLSNSIIIATRTRGLILTLRQVLGKRPTP